MPTTNPKEAISLDEAAFRAARQAFFSAGTPSEPGRIGLEQELFVISTDNEQRPAGRVALEGAGGVFETLDRVAFDGANMRPWQGSGPWEYQLGNGGRLTFEPGGQIEHSTVVHATVAAALDDVLEVQNMLRRAFQPRDQVIAAAGLDLWHCVDEVEMQLTAGRYTSMAAYFDQRGPWGRVMMRHTGSLQINLDHGADGVWQERWRLANLLAPHILAAFAASPGAEGLSTRALAWQRLDPSRTGFPQRFVSGDGDDPFAEWAEAALDADILLVQAMQGGWAAGRPGFSFRDWILHGDPRLGWPTAADLDYHLTTLFFEVRPRGFLELRSCESLPGRLRPAPVVLVTALLYDHRARRDALAQLDGTRSRLPELWRAAAVRGIRDPELGCLADSLWQTALAGAARLPLSFFGAGALATARSFLDRFTLAGRMPADELGELNGDRRATLAWATGSSLGAAPTVAEDGGPWVAVPDAAPACVCRTA